MCSNAYLVLEYIEMQSGGDWAELGKGLAQMHRLEAPEFGYTLDNTIGSTRQSNLNRTTSWVEFFRDSRLKFQFNLAEQKGNKLKGVDQLLDKLEDLLGGNSPAPSLVHGDLWSGNASFDSEGRGVIFDPACYYGDREVDLAMTELFGGFSSEFYRAYNEEYPLAEGYERRKNLYNLYHIVNHLNLFGSSYKGQAEAIIQSYL